MPFKKGDPNINRKGAPPKEWSWAGLIRKQMEATGLDGREVREAVTASLVAKALEGDVNAMKEIGNRLDGMPKQSNDITSNGESLNGLITVIKHHKSE